MNPINLETELRPQVRTLQIIVAALPMGAVVFLTGTLVIRSGDEPAVADPMVAGLGLMTLMALFMTVSVVVARLIVPALMTSSARQSIANGTWQPQATGAVTKEFFERTGDAGKLCVVYTTRTIVAVALLEGAAFMAIIAYMMEGSTVALGLSIALIAAILLHFPTAPRVVAWIERQLRRITEERDISVARRE